MFLRKAAGIKVYMSVVSLTLILVLCNYTHNDTHLHSLMIGHPFHTDEQCKCNHAWLCSKVNVVICCVALRTLKARVN